MRRHTHVIVVLGVLCAAVAAAQGQRPRAEVTPVVSVGGVRPGSTVAVVLKVKLPKNVHVQADKPKDASLIATSLTIDAPPGVSVDKIVYPPATELAQQGRAEKLLVFGPEFAIEARLAVAPSVAAGELVVPVRLRYQACNETMCFPPARAEAQWTLTIVDSGFSGFDCPN
jgi:DsbC/DsbD-like thiol-disulfide interchange protein